MLALASFGLDFGVAVASVGFANAASSDCRMFCALDVNGFSGGRMGDRTRCGAISSATGTDVDCTLFGILIFGCVSGSMDEFSLCVVKREVRGADFLVGAADFFAGGGMGDCSPALVGSEVLDANFLVSDKDVSGGVTVVVRILLGLACLVVERRF